MNKPNFELLKDAYAIIYGLPEEVVYLDRIIKSRGKSLECGTVACAFGWLGMHPDFKKRMNHNGCGWSNWVIDGTTHTHYSEAAAALFEISVQDGRNLFTASRNSKYDGRHQGSSHKGMFLHRVESFLKEHGQWRGLQTEAAPC